MKKLLLFLSMMFIPLFAHATTCNIPYGGEITGGIIYAAHWNANIAAIEACLNNQTLDGTTNIAIGGIQTANIANSAVTDAKIAGITTASKVNGSAITQINNLPAGAGLVPIANLPVGTGSGNIPQLTATQNAAATSYLLPVPAIGGLFGSWASETKGTVYQAATDGFVTASCTSTSGGTILEGITDSSASPSTIRVAQYNAVTNYAGITFPVRKNDYWEVLDTSGTCSAVPIYFLPLGS